MSSWRRCKHLWDLGPYWGKSAIPVQSALLWISQLDFQNQSMSCVSLTMRHVSLIYESCLFYPWFICRLSMSYVSLINESCLFYQWFISLLSMSRVSRINESRTRYTTGCNTLQSHHSTLHHTTTLCNTLQLTATQVHNRMQFGLRWAPVFEILRQRGIKQSITVSGGSFAKETYKRDDILQKRPKILSILD